MSGELRDLREHLERYRATTLQVFELVDDEEMSWRPAPEQYSLGQQLLHIAQAEDRFVQGIFHGDWSLDRVRFPERLPSKREVEAFMRDVRGRLLRGIAATAPEELDRLVEVPGTPDLSLRSWLWFVLEHELHHRGQIWAYLRALGKVPPFYAAPLPLGERPDVAAREELGGF